MMNVTFAGKNNGDGGFSTISYPGGTLGKKL